MNNPFDNEDLEFLVLKNQNMQFSLWPNFKTIPQGWQIVYGPEDRDNCLQYVEHNWTDIRPQHS